MKKDYTQFILENYEASRSDDVLLIYYHLRRHGLNLTPQQLKQLTEICESTVSLYDLVRYRQKIQSIKDKNYNEKLLGTPEVMAQRHKNGQKRTEQEREEKAVSPKKSSKKSHYSPAYKEYVKPNGEIGYMRLDTSSSTLTI